MSTSAPVSGSSSGTSNATSTVTNNSMNLSALDFVKLMITQLQNQDPLQPTSNSELLSQMSQIGQLQASTTTQATMQTVALQTQIGAAGNLIGKTVQGADDNGKTVQGVVDSVRVVKGSVYLDLDSSASLQLSNVTKITPPPAQSTGTTTGASSSTGTSKTS